MSQTELRVALETYDRIEGTKLCEHGNVNCDESVLRSVKIEINGDLFLQRDEVPARCPGGYREVLVFE